MWVIWPRWTDKSRGVRVVQKPSEFRRHVRVPALPKHPFIIRGLQGPKWILQSLLWDTHRHGGWESPEAVGPNENHLWSRWCTSEWREAFEWRTAKRGYLFLQGPTIPFWHLNSLHADFYLDLNQISHIHKYQSPKHTWLFSLRSMNYSLRNQRLISQC